MALLHTDSPTRRTGLLGKVAALTAVVAAGAFGVVAGASDADAQSPIPVQWNGPGRAQGFTYATEGAVAGTSTTASAMVITPDGTAPAGGWPVIAFSHGTTGTAP